MHSEFVVGDLVQLDSGGPVMTVVGIDSNGWLTCRWREGDAVRTGKFPPGAVHRAS